MANNISFGGGNGGGGSSTLSGLSDVTLSAPTNGQVLKYDGSKWVNGAGGGSSGHTYSTTEQVVGAWIDGKPIYEITIVLTSAIEIATNTWTDIDGTNFSNAETFVGGSLINSNSAYVGLIMLDKNTTTNKLRVLQARSSTVSCKAVIVRYTKTST